MTGYQSGITGFTAVGFTAVGFTAVGFTAVVNSCLRNIFLNFIQNFSKSLIVNYMIKLDKSNDHNDFFSIVKLKGLFSISNVRKTSLIFSDSS
jgi:hypothetical protein